MKMKHPSKIPVSQLAASGDPYATPACARDHKNICFKCKYDDCIADNSGTCDAIRTARQKAKGEKK